MTHVFRFLYVEEMLPEHFLELIILFGLFFESIKYDLFITSVFSSHYFVLAHLCINFTQLRNSSDRSSSNYSLNLRSLLIVTILIINACSSLSNWVVSILGLGHRSVRRLVFEARNSEDFHWSIFSRQVVAITIIFINKHLTLSSLRNFNFVPMESLR